MLKLLKYLCVSVMLLSAAKVSQAGVWDSISSQVDAGFVNHAKLSLERDTKGRDQFQFLVNVFEIGHLYGGPIAAVDGGIIGNIIREDNKVNWANATTGIKIHLSHLLRSKIHLPSDWQFFQRLDLDARTSYDWKKDPELVGKDHFNDHVRTGLSFGYPLIYQSDILAKEVPSIVNGILTIVTGFVTDFASVPRVPIAYTLFGDKAHHESVPHDFLYQTHLVSKAIADRVFLEAMTVRKKPAYIRYPMYWGVVLGGKSSYDSGPSRYLVLNKEAPNA